MEIKDLINKKNVVIRCINTKLPAITKGWHQRKATTLPEVMVLKDVYNYGPEINLNYFSKGAEDFKNAYVPPDFKVEVIQDKELIKELHKHMIENLQTFLYGKPHVGSDPEMFVEDGNGIVIPAFNFLGSKTKPNKTAEGTYGDKPLYWDGFQAEFETAANSCLAWQVDSVQAGLKGLYDAAIKHNPEAKLSTKTTVDVPQSMLLSAAEEHVSFGCTPSYNIYDMKGMDKHGRDVPFRSAGGHIHFGCGVIKGQTLVNVMKALDAVLGVACVSLFEKYDDPRRRVMYGLAGEYRLPPHGLEYRVLSNAWMYHPLIMNLVFDLARRAFRFGETGLIKEWKGSSKETIAVINSCDAVGARKILERNKDLFQGILKASYYAGEETDKELLYNIFYNGMDSAVEDATDLIKNWNLKGDRWVRHSDGAGKNWLTGRNIIADKRKVG